MAVSETATGWGKRKSTKAAVSTAVGLLIGAQVFAAGALSTGGSISTSGGKIALSGSRCVHHPASDNASHSVSIGVAVRTAGMNSMEDLLKTADLGVYAAKRNGRNCVAMAD